MLISIDNLSVSYGGIAALRGVSLEIDQGEIVTLIGSNGAGKTTLLRTISGLLRSRSGSIHWTGASTAVEPPAPVVSLGRVAPHKIVELGISHVPEGRQVFPALTIRDNLLLGAYREPSREQIDRDIDRCYDLFPVLKERQSQRAGTLSGGEQQMLAIARALMARPKLLLLDEPSLGLAPLIVRKIFEIIRTINSEGTTIFLVEQNAHLALSVAHRAYVLQTGQVIMSGKAAELAEHPDVKRAYLGG